MSQAWCGLCGLGPVDVGEMAEHYARVHGPNQEPPPARPTQREVRREQARAKAKATKPKPKPKAKAKPAAKRKVATCSECGIPLLEDEEGTCAFCA